MQTATKAVWFMNTMFLPGLRHKEQKQCPSLLLEGAAAKIPFVAPSSSLLRQTGRSTSQQYNISVLVFGGLSGGITNNNTYIFTTEDELSIID